MEHLEEARDGFRTRKVREMLEQAREKHLQGCLEIAQELYHQAMANAPEDPEAYYGLGQMALQCEAPSLARNYFRIAKELGMSHPRDGAGEE